MPGHFDRKLFTFLFDLDINNDRGWFDANRDRFESEVREPLLAFIRDVEQPLKRVSKHLVADARKQGGSMFRIHRDTRFSNDKSPYKTWAAAQFRHELGRDVHAPGLYLHLEPGNVFVGAGIWHPDSSTIGRIRARIDEHPTEWKRVRNAAWLRGDWELGGDVLKTAPRGYDRDHPLIEDLRRKDFIAVRTLDERTAQRADFLDTFIGLATEAKPLMRFLCRAIDVDF